MQKEGPRLLFGKGEQRSNAGLLKEMAELLKERVFTDEVSA